MLMLIAFAALAAVAIVATIATVARDGYRRVRTDCERLPDRAVTAGQPAARA